MQSSPLTASAPGPMEREVAEDRNRMIDRTESGLLLLILALLVLVVIASISEALIAFDLSDLVGRVLLVGAVVVQALVSVILLFFVFGPLIHQAVADAFASGTFNTGPITDASARIDGLSAYTLLDSIPALMFAAAFYRTYKRVRRKDKPPLPRSWLMPQAPSPPSL